MGIPFSIFLSVIFSTPIGLVIWKMVTQPRPIVIIISFVVIALALIGLTVVWAAYFIERNM